MLYLICLISYSFLNIITYPRDYLRHLYDASWFILTLYLFSIYIDIHIVKINPPIWFFSIIIFFGYFAAPYILLFIFVFLAHNYKTKSVKETLYLYRTHETMSWFVNLHFYFYYMPPRKEGERRWYDQPEFYFIVLKYMFYFLVVGVSYTTYMGQYSK